MTNIERFASIIANRPNYRPERPTANILRQPACEHQCGTCYMACAIAPERLDWWQDQLALACGSTQIGRA